MYIQTKFDLQDPRYDGLRTPIYQTQEKQSDKDLHSNSSRLG